MVTIITIITIIIIPTIIITTGTIGTSALIRAGVWEPKPDTTSHSAPVYASGPFLFAQQLRQLGDIHCDPPRLIARETIWLGLTNDV